MGLGLWNRIKSNHFAQMALCCMFPVLLIVALQAVGVTGFWLLAVGIVACIGGHLVVMAFASKEEKSCH